MSRREDESEKRRYGSVKAAAAKMALGSTGSFLKLPKDVQIWKPKAGIYKVNVLPYVAGTRNTRADEGELWWEYTYHVHGNIGANNERFICPARTLKKRCPICEYREKLRAREDEDDEKLIKSLNTKQRQLINLEDTKEPDKGVQLYEVSNFLFGDKLMEDLVGAEEDSGWDLFFSLEDGLTLKIQFIEDSYSGRSFVKANRFDFLERKKEYDEDILDEVHSLEELIKVLPYDELKEKFLAVKKEDDDDDEKDKDDDDDDRPAKKRKKHKEESDADEGDDDWEKDKAKPKKHKPKDEDDSDGDDDDEEKPKKRRKPVDEGDDDGDDEPPKKKKKREEDDDDEGESDEEKPKKKKKKSDDDDDADGDDDGDDDKKGWDDFDDDDKKKKKKKTSDDDDDDEEKDKDDDDGDDDGDDDEEAKPRRKRRSRA